MDHIPPIRDPNLEIAHITVPYLARNWEYGSQIRGFDSFRAFPQKHGYSQKPDDNDGLVAPSIDFLQAWLYFGLLAEAFGTTESRFNPSHFIELSQTDATVVTTKELNRYIEYWAAAVAHGGRDEIDEHSANLDKCLELANVVVNAFSDVVVCEKQGGWAETTVVLFSIITLVDYLRRARIDINIYTYELSLPALNWDFPPLDQALLAAGWCPGEISKLNTQTDCSTRFYLANIDRWAPGKDHRRCTARAGCQAHQIDESTYRTRHRPDCKGDAVCWSLGPPPGDIAQVIADGGYPLVNLSHNGREVQVHLAKQGDLYVTISHVWSDGLGNPHNNTLPHCQLLYIQDLVNSLYPETSTQVKFWVDTMCIPVDPDHLKFRRMAINRMGDTYRRSSKTLALDNSLMIQESTDMDWVEMNMRIKYCPWVSRAWTLLEGRVGMELMFQFKDNAVSSNIVFNRSYATRNILAVSGMLERRGVESVLEEPNALRLVRALVLLPKDPMPELEDGEDADRAAVRTAALEVYDTWMPALEAAGLAQDPSELDDYMCVNIQTQVFCPVTKHSNIGTRNIRDELWLEDTEPSSANSPACYVYFDNISSAFRGRTTSKAEDESICFGQMLGIDTSKLIEIQPLRPRARSWLTFLDSYAALRTLCWALGVDVRARLMDCQERRIKTLLLEIEKLPLSIILWNVPRLQSVGWKWAPMSMLDANPGLAGGWVSNERGTVGPDGFTIKLPGLQLKEAAQTKAAMSDLKISDPVYFVVTIADDGLGQPGVTTATFKICLEGDAALARRKTWSALLSSGVLNNLVIMTRRRASIHDPFKSRGVLLEFRERRDSVKLAHFRAVIERPHEVSEGDSPTIPVDGVWDMDSAWCIG
ncbi:hypothetical protein BJX99DRAFT_239542 [Aspergillus californicus]